MGLRRDQGIVLRGYPFGEADRVVVFLSPNHGMVRAVAKGVRKTKSRFGGRLEPFNQVDLVLYEGRNLDTVTQVTPIDVFPHLRQDLDKVTVAGTMTEAAGLVVQEGESSVRLYLLLQRGLYTLDREPLHPDLLTSFLLKLAGVVGVAPALDLCVSCGQAEPLSSFSFGAGGAVCSRCQVEGAFLVRAGTMEYLGQLAAADFGDLPDTHEDLSASAQGTARRFVEFHIERSLRTLVLLDV
ncbi:MAG: DNA repair protein RecO [Acidimicrobiia bacterium]